MKERKGEFKCPMNFFQDLPMLVYPFLNELGAQLFFHLFFEKDPIFLLATSVTQFFSQWKSSFWVVLKNAAALIPVYPYADSIPFR